MVEAAEIGSIRRFVIMNSEQRKLFIVKVMKQYRALKHVREVESQFRITDKPEGLGDRIFKKAVTALSNYGFAIAQRRRKKAKAIVNNMRVKKEICNVLENMLSDSTEEEKIPLIVDAIFESEVLTGSKVPRDAELLGACCDEILSQDIEIYCESALDL